MEQLIDKLKPLPYNPDLGDLDEDNIVNSIISYLEGDGFLTELFPGLREILKKLRDNDVSEGYGVSSEEFTRELLRSVRNHHAFKESFAKLDAETQQKINDFMEGKNCDEILGGQEFTTPLSPGAKEHFESMEQAEHSAGLREWLESKGQTYPKIYEDKEEKKLMKVYVNADFDNWGLTVHNKPLYTFVPTTVEGVKNLVLFAKQNGLRVRAAGYRHSWSHLFSENDQILVSNLDINNATAVPDPSSILPSRSYPGNEFKKIELYNEDIPGSGGKKRLARIGVAVTNEEFRRWAIQNNAWTVPMNVIMVEITAGGANAPICHGAGIRNKTLSDIVREIQYVDANGVHQSVSDPRLLRAAAGCFGLLGFVTHITLELDKMTYAVLKPLKQDINLAIPPPHGFKVPYPIRKSYSPSQIEAARKDFENKTLNDYYAEWFWFPYKQQAWVNCWNNTESSKDVYDYPSSTEVLLQWITGWLGGVINDSKGFRKLPGHWQAWLLATLALMSMPPHGPFQQEIRTYLIDALHFRRGIQNMRVTDLELEIPIPALASDPTKPDLSVMQQAWWDAISEVYADRRAPLRIALEVRIMSDSNMAMAPQANNTFGTASIEVLTSTAAVADGTWAPFVQKVANKWMSYKDGKGVRLNVRPHWAKMWDDLLVDGNRPFKEYLKNVSYKAEIPLFKSLLAEIGAFQGWNLEDLKETFSNELLDYLLFE